MDTGVLCMVAADKQQEAAIAAFEKLGVCRQLAEAAASLGWKEPSSIQQQGVPLLLQGKFADCQTLLANQRQAVCHSLATT